MSLCFFPAFFWVDSHQDCGNFRPDLSQQVLQRGPLFTVTQVSGAVLHKSGWLISSDLRTGLMEIETLSQQTSPQTELCPVWLPSCSVARCLAFELPSYLIILVVCVPSNLIRDNPAQDGTPILKSILLPLVLEVKEGKYLISQSMILN